MHDINITFVFQEIATVNANREVQRAQNESLKRMKVHWIFFSSFYVCCNESYEWDHFSEMSFSILTYLDFLYSQLDIGSQSHNNPSSTDSVELQCTLVGQPHQRLVPSEALTRATQDDTHSQASESRPNGIESTGESSFLIPDLNMMPSDDGSCTGALCGMSWERRTLGTVYTMYVGETTLNNVQADREHFEASTTQ